MEERTSRLAFFPDLLGQMETCWVIFQSGYNKNKPLIWEWFIVTIYGDDGGMVYYCYTHISRTKCCVFFFFFVRWHWRYLRQAWQTHRNDTSLTVHVHNIVARFWDRASGDNQWICSPAQIALGKVLIMSGQSDP